MNIFNAKKDIDRFRQTNKEIKRLGRKIEERSPLLSSVTKSVAITIKWLLIVGIIAGMILMIILVTRYYTIVLPEERNKDAREEYQNRLEKHQACLDECDVKYPSVSGLRGYVPIGKPLSEKKVLHNNCLSDCKEEYTK
jgi:hypothetical protein